MTQFSDVAQCPRCRGALTHELSCHCGFHVRTDEHGIYRLTDDDSFYYREKMPRDRLQRVVAATDFFRAAYRTFKIDNPWRYDFYALDANRGAGLILANLHPGALVLDYGAGWGNLSRFASLYSGHVFTMDLTYESLLFCRRSIETDRITYLHGGNERYLPFTDKSLDVVILNGVLEWIPEYDRSATPQAIQQTFLREVSRVLKTDGHVFIGIENRFGLRYFLGRPDEHTGIRFATVLPRTFSDYVSRRRSGKPFRNYTYSYWGYHRLLKEAGFARVVIDIPYSDYRDISKAYLGRGFTRQQPPVFSESPVRWKRMTKNAVGQLLFSSAILKFFGHAFWIRTNEPSRNLLGGLLASRRETDRDVLTISNDADKGIVFVETGRSIYKIPAHPTASQNLRREVEALNWLCHEGWLVPYLPQVHLVTFGDASVQIVNKALVSARNAAYYDRIDQFVELRRRYTTRARLLDASQQHDLQRVREYLELNDRRDWFDKILLTMSETLVDGTVTHGDFHSGNILPAENGLLIIDWDHVSRWAPYEFDLLDLVLNEERSVSGRAFGELAQDLLASRLRLSRRNRFSSFFSVVQAAHPHVITLYFLRRLSLALGRYHHVAFVPQRRDGKLKALLDSVAGYAEASTGVPALALETRAVVT